MRIVRLERTSGGELSKFVSDHIFGHVDGQKVFPVVDGEVQANEVRSNR